MHKGIARTLALGMCVLIAAGPMAAAQDDAPASVQGLIVVGGEAAVPRIGEGAPNYSPEQIAGVICKALDDGLSNAALYALERAHEASVRARETRREFLKGRASESQLRSTELQRQRAMDAMQRQPASQLPPAAQNSLVLEQIRQSRVVENGRPVVMVSGVVRNTGGERAYVPPVSVFALDAQDFALASQTNAIDPEILEAGQASPFSLRFRNPPTYTARVHAAFAPPFQLRAFRGCSFFDPRLFDAAKLDVQKLSSTAGPKLERPGANGAPAYMAAELAALGRITYADAIDAYLSTQARREAGKAEQDGCSPMQDWRKLMDLVERIEEAWIATNAAEEVRRDAERGVFLPQEVDEAEDARAKAIHAFHRARPDSRPAAGVSGGLELVRSEVKARGAGAGTVVIGGAIRNLGDRAAANPPVLLTVKDEFGYVVTERLLPTPMTVAPRTMRNFSFEIDLPPALTKDVSMKLAC